MKSVQEAFDVIMEGMPPAGTSTVSLSRSMGLVLAEDVVSDIDMPPFDRSAMDGYALRGVCDSYGLLSEIHAGAGPSSIEGDGLAAPIMTGAPVPRGADRVVMVEETQLEEGRLFVNRMPERGENVCFRAEDIRKGQTVLRKGDILTPAEAGIAAMAGRNALKVFTRPSVSIITTGTEVIPPEKLPLPGQVRNANSPLMEALLSMNGYRPAGIFHCGDDPKSLGEAFAGAARVSDVLITAGGISMGTRDYVPQVLQEMGYAFHFRTVAQKPGKPFSFATGERVVFGLPGNPVSVLVSLEMYVLSALRLSSGHSRFRRRTLAGVLRTPLVKKRGRQYFFRCVASMRDGAWELSVPETSGSGDLMSAGGTNAIAWLPPESSGASGGEPVPFSPMSWAGGESFWE